MTDDPRPRPATRRPAEVARYVTLGASGVITFGLVGYFGITARPSPPPADLEPGPTAGSGVVSTVAPSAVPPPTAVPLSVMASTSPPGGSAPVPVTTAVASSTSPPIADVVTERSR
ncbi:hypothetical protein [Desertimonas flava]|jgi:hypothetical protein|uniref:hypothetical protein n=1 Tax=Desertimonas flava TaxID=2064846 RepID=UPI0013C516BE|nr:hypothetical protein [Desertimonas flava]